MSHENIRVEREGVLATIVLDRADKRNALTAAMLQELRTVAEGFRDEPDVRAVVIRGEGAHFSVGADISQMGGTAPSTVHLRRTAEAGALLMRAIREIHQPTICAMQGIATGGATCIATACDFRIGTPDARIGYGEVKLGINLMWHALPLAIQTVGLSRAKTMVMTGDLFDAETMREWGFFDRIVPGADLAAEAAERQVGTAVGGPGFREELHHAADGVLTVHRRGGALDELHTLHQIGRQQREVGVALQQAQRHAVDQHQHVLGIAQATGLEAGEVVALGAVLQAWHRAQRVLQRLGTGGVHLGPVDDGGRKRYAQQVFVQTRRGADDALAGDLHAGHFGRLGPGPRAGRAQGEDCCGRSRPWRAAGGVQGGLHLCGDERTGRCRAQVSAHARP